MSYIITISHAADDNRRFNVNFIIVHVTLEDLSHLVSQGASSSKNELLDFFGMDPQAPTASALNQQRAKLKPEALEMVFRQFNSFMDSLDRASS